MNNEILKILERNGVKLSADIANIRISENKQGIAYDVAGNEKKYWMKAGKFLKKYAIDLQDTDVQRIAGELNNFFKSLNLSSINDDKYLTRNFEFAYNADNYHKGDGNLNHSCMRRYADEVHKFYSLISEDILKIYYEKDDDGRVIGRALVWNFPGGRYIDRPYSYDGYFDIKIPYEYHYLNGKYASQIFIALGITLEQAKEDNLFFPYMDTFYLLYKDNDGRLYLSNSYDRSHSKYHYIANCQATNGDIGLIARNYCCHCDRSIPDDDVIYIDDEIYCENCAVYSEYYGQSIPRHNAYYIDDLEDWFYVDDDNIAYSEYDQRYYLADDTVYIDNDYYDGDYYHKSIVIKDWIGNDILTDDMITINNIIFHSEDPSLIEIDGSYYLSVSSIKQIGGRYHHA